jgi:hypothetical protein
MSENLRAMSVETLDQLCINTIRTLSSTRCSGPNPAPRNAYGASAAGVYHLESRHALRPAGLDLAQPRLVSCYLTASRLGFNLDQADGYFGSVRSPIAKSRHPFNLDQRAGPLASLNIKAPTWAGCPVSRL